MLRVRTGFWGAMSALAALVASPAAADVWVYGNGVTLDVMVYGNSDASAEQLADAAFAITREGWHPLWQGEARQTGWISVACVRRADGGTQFEFATEQPGETVALDLARRAAEQYVSRHGGKLIGGCGGAVNHQGQLLTTRFKATAGQ